MTLPILDVAGDCGLQGEAHGRLLAGAVAHNIAVYERRLAGEVGLTLAEIAERAGTVWNRIEALAPDYADGVRGIARGAGVDLGPLQMLNARYEIVYSRLSEMKMSVSECTAFAVTAARSGNGHWLIGQNWDWIPEVAGAVVRTAAASDAPAVLAFTEAGIFGGKVGLNQGGLGLAVNGLGSSGDDWSRGGEPFHVRTWRALRSAALDDAVAILTAPPHSCSANFLVAQAGIGARDIETAPEGCARLEPRGGLLVHTNHFTDAPALGVSEPPSPRRKYSLRRAERIQELIEADPAPTPAGFQQHLRDHDGHPSSICRHPAWDEGEVSNYQTVSSVIMDLDRRVLWATDGPPCDAEYQEIHLEAEAPR